MLRLLCNAYHAYFANLYAMAAQDREKNSFEVRFAYEQASQRHAVQIH